MQSRKDLKRYNHRNNLYLIIAGIILILAVIFGVVLYNNHVASQKRAREFAVDHFNPNVTIYGVKVGNLTVNKATTKINTRANNMALLENGKVTIERDPDTTTIDADTVNTYFKEQHTSMPNKQGYTYDFKQLKAAAKKLKTISKAKITYQVAGKNYNLPAKKMVNQLTFKKGKYSFNNVENLTAKLNQIDKDVSTLHKSYTFAVPSNTKLNSNKITVKNQSYGWGVYIKKAQEAVEQAYLNQTKTIDGQDYIYGLGYSTYGLGYGKNNHGIGDNYVVVSLKKQEIWIVRKGKLAVHLTDVVTGTKDGGKGNRTPQGVWYIQDKQSPATLRGRNDDGSKYASKVQYWMPFTLSGCGLHDASWRTDWSKKAYLRGGSHGCVNIKPSEIKQVWHNVVKHEAVIVYN
ncbi:L,D-transpeptidase family protein [Lactobacillus sp. ESL0701]|uniref:L,D-transpeptidase family protein n=1 Tax=Lactobacillus sp. ESL0701 TaxID=2983217 RepID=UPI0023F74BD9|nr:L,D-transpeptidase family protein [Lactobacillus sp. ESL0701]MDF7672818.1 L,D-transpeptidase family protein [Lactobacillus sp. ESL0701]